MRFSYSNRKMAGYIILCAVLLAGTGKSQIPDPKGNSVEKINFTKSAPSQNEVRNFFQKRNIEKQSEDVWEPAGPNGISANCIAVDPNNSNIIFAGGFSGLYKTTNGGTNWALAGTETLTKFIIAVSVSPDNPDVVFCQSSTEVMKSTDGGNSWNNLLQSISYTDFPHYIYMSSTRPGRVLIYSDSVYASTDTGNTWHTSSTFGHVILLSEYSQNPDIIYAIGDSAGTFMLFKTLNWGLDWTVVNKDLSTMLLPNWIYTLQVSSDNPDVIFAGGRSIAKNEGGLSRSTDGGQTWLRIVNGFGENKSVFAVANDPADPKGVYAGGYATGLYHSSDLGDSWNLVSGAIQDYYIDGLSASDNGNVYCCFGGSIYSVSNGGASWKSLNGDLKSIDVFKVIIDPSNDNLLYACSLGGVYKSTDGGTTWQQKNNGILDSDVRELAIDPVNNSILYAGTYFGLIYKSTNAGDNWIVKQNLAADGGTNPVRRIYINPKNSNYIWTNQFGTNYKSTNAGESWSNYTIDGHWVGESVFCQNQSDTGYALAGDYGDSLLCTTDGGLNWSLKSVNKFIYLLTIVPNAPDVLYADSSGGYLIKSTNGGITWNVIDSDHSSIENYRNIYVNTGNSSCIYASSFGGGINRSTDAGLTWNYYNTGLPYSDVFCITSSNSHPNKLFASVYGGGIYKVNQSVTSVNNRLSGNFSFSLAQNYPNPFNPSTVISYQLPADGVVTIKVYDILGKEVELLVNGYRKAGKYSVSFDASKLTSGVYFYQLRSGSFVSTKKMILLR